jgi:large subunit ribosomal protein L29
MAMAVELKKLRTMTVEQLAGEVRELREEIWKLRLQRSTGQLQNSHKVRATRHDLARVKTVMQERQGGDA